MREELRILHAAAFTQPPIFLSSHILSKKPLSKIKAYLQYLVQDPGSYLTYSAHIHPQFPNQNNNSFPPRSSLLTVPLILACYPRLGT
jgi:hypothetical protein